jgi:hypothetical protein
MKTDLHTNRADKVALTAIALDYADAVFAEPWEARAFALALTLSEGGQFSWDEFRNRLIAEIAEADAAAIATGTRLQPRRAARTTNAGWPRLRNFCARKRCSTPIRSDGAPSRSPRLRPHRPKRKRAAQSKSPRSSMSIASSRPR